MNFIHYIKHVVTKISVDLPTKDSPSDSLRLKETAQINQSRFFVVFKAVGPTSFRPRVARAKLAQNLFFENKAV